MKKCAYLNDYLDIETTGLDSREAEITVIGIYTVNDTESRLVQLISPDITKESVFAALENTAVHYTYNGRRFDIPFIEAKLGINLETLFYHHDLMYDCWNCNLRGGLKAVEKQLGIPRNTGGISGLDAINLWMDYRNKGNKKALETLLDYNREDVVNLKILKEKLLPVPAIQ